MSIIFQATGWKNLVYHRFCLQAAVTCGLTNHKYANLTSNHKILSKTTSTAGPVIDPANISINEGDPIDLCQEYTLDI